jgi:hypothetical protein
MAQTTTHARTDDIVIVDDRPGARTGWVGWLYFAAVVMMIAGAMGAFQGLVAIVNDNWVVWSNQTAVALYLTAWGWIHLVIGVVVFAAGLGLLTGHLIARIVAVAAVAVNLMAQFLFLPVYPLWALTIMAIDLVVLWAICAHGNELRTTA